MKEMELIIIEKFIFYPFVGTKENSDGLGWPMQILLFQKMEDYKTGKKKILLHLIFFYL